METAIAGFDHGVDLVEQSDSLNDLILEIWPHQLERAVVLAEEARDLAQEAGDPVLVIRALETLGYLFWQKSDYPRAMTALLEALNIVRTIGDRAREASVLDTIAAMNYDLGSYTESLAHYHKALAIAQALEERVRQAYLLSSIGFVYYQLEQPDNALSNLRKSLSISQQDGYVSIEAAALYGLGQVYYQAGDYEQCLRYAQQCRNLARQMGLTRSTIDATITMGKTYDALGQLENALSHFHAALNLASETGRHLDEASVLVETGKIYLRQKEPARALARSGIALRIAGKTGQKQLLYEIHQALSDIYAQSGDYRRALEHHRQFHALKEDICSNQADHRIKSLQVTHEVEQTRHDAEIYALKNVELQRQIAAKERLIDDLDAFATMVAHDLKSPLSVIIANAELIVRDEQSVLSDYGRERFDDLLHMGYKMGCVIDDLLVLAGVRREDITPEPVHMEAIVRDVQKRLSRLINRHEATFILPDRWPVGLGHPGLIEEVWVNYISNAIKYGGDPPVVALGAAPQPDGTIRYWVQDNGDGIRPEQQHRLFTEYARLDRAHSAEGTGLGLAIVKRIVDRLGGEVGVVSAGAPNQGCTFTFTLPAANGH